MTEVTRETLIAGLETYRERIYELMEKSTDANKVNLLGIRYETAARVINELMKGQEEVEKTEKLEQLASTSK